jgi:glutathione S-transferase
MGLTLYEMKGCPWCQKVADRLQELDVDYETVWVPERHSQRDNLKQISGQRQVPLLVDDKRGVTMPESARILEYIDANYA